MKPRLLIFIALILISKKDFAQTVSGWDAAITSQYLTNNYHLIGTYQGWDPEAVYIAGYNFFNNSSFKTKRVFMGGITADLQYGNVGIGITNPQNKLDVNGTIHAKQVKVDLTGWPDYVFKKDYQLPSLTDVKTYIDQNQHLPDMPSEAEIAKDGLNLGEMNKLLLKKVEELTLYLIEKDKKEKEQEIRITKLENIINNKR